MKKILIAFAFSLLSVTAFAEATFQQVETFIEQQQYEVASLALKEIIANHPNSAKAYYAMSQAQAGLGNLEKAQFALNKAKSIDPELKFATSSNIASLEQAITPQTKKIEVVTESHFWRNLFIALVVAGLFYGLYRFFTRKRDDVDTRFTGVDYGDPKPSGPKGPTGPTTPIPSYTSSTAPSPAPAPSYGYASAPAPTVVNNHYGSSNDGLLTGVLVGEMLANNSHHHDTVIVEQPVYVAPSYVAPAPSRSSSWDDTPAPTPSRSSSWDDDSSSKKSSSWDSGSSSSSSSWDSSSSSSDSSWDSSSSSSSSDW
jgi:hypothetical protein